MSSPRPRSRRLALVVAAAALSVAATSGGCTLFVAEPCPDLDEVCPDVVCDNYKQNRDGCSECECEGPSDPVVCWEDSECAAGERCDTVNFCEPAPGCDPEGGACPDACYGQCVPAPSTCASDADCPAGQVCRVFDDVEPQPGEEDRPGGEPGDPPEPAPPPAPTGVCTDVSCGAEGDLIALPECPPGSELVFDENIDPCNPICVPVDRCRELLPEECLSTPGCELLAEPCGCAVGDDNCDCANVERCVAVDDCAQLSIDECELNPNCVLKPVGNSGGGGSGGNGGGEPDPGVPCDPDDPSCGALPPPDEPPPVEELVCVPRSVDGTCFSDADCAPGEICQLVTVCGSGCEIDEAGNENCFEECWTERGECVPSSNSCFDLSPDQCLADPRCQLVQGEAPCICSPDDPNCACTEPAPAPVCVPVEGSCTSDLDCPNGHCEFSETCQPCDPSTGEDIGCIAPCFSEGRCVDGAPPPTTCSSDADCNGGTCTVITVCETCPDQDPNDFVPCEQTCRDELVCVNVPSPGTPQLCQEDAHCGPGQRCGQELELCAENPDAPNTGCWKICVDDNRDGTVCTDSNECGADETCRFDAEVCLDDPASGLICAAGWCVGACGDALTPAVDPATGQCVVFNDTCIPPGWENAPNGCQ